MFLVLGTLCERVCRTTFLACVAVSAVSIPLAAGLALPQMHYYRGLSGLDSALFVLLAVQLIRMNWSSDRAMAATAAFGLGAFVLKTVYECVTGSIIFVQPESTFTPVPLAHIVGGTIGLLIAAKGGKNEHNNHPEAFRARWAGPVVPRVLRLECGGRAGVGE